MQKLETAIQRFTNHCLYEKRLSSKTLKAYRIDLEQFLKFVKENGYPNNVQKTDKEVLRNYVQDIIHFKPKTVKRKIACLKAFFNYLEYEDKIAVNPFRKFRLQLREPRNLPNVMNLYEIEKILRYLHAEKNKAKKDSVYAYAEKVRNTAVVELLFATGARVSEISGLKVDYMDLISGQIRLRGKGNKERIIQVCNRETQQVLKEYHRLFKKQIVKGGGYFFINRLGNRLSEQSIRFLVKRVAQQVKVGRTITPHAFRHSFATLLLEEDVDIKYIQHLLGHSSIMTTQIYTHVNTEKQKQILTQSHPRNFVRVG